LKNKIRRRKSKKTKTKHRTQTNSLNGEETSSKGSNIDPVVVIVGSVCGGILLGLGFMMYKMSRKSKDIPAPDNSDNVSNAEESSTDGPVEYVPLS